MLWINDMLISTDAILSITLNILIMSGTSVYCMWSCDDAKIINAIFNISRYSNHEFVAITWNADVTLKSKILNVNIALP